jgi:hypothetical protein
MAGDGDNGAYSPNTLRAQKADGAIFQAHPSLPAGSDRLAGQAPYRVLTGAPNRDSLLFPNREC